MKVTASGLKTKPMLTGRVKSIGFLFHFILDNEGSDPCHSYGTSPIKFVALTTGDGEWMIADEDTNALCWFVSALFSGSPSRAASVTRISPPGSRTCRRRLAFRWIPRMRCPRSLMTRRRSASCWRTNTTQNMVKVSGQLHCSLPPKRAQSVGLVCVRKDGLKHPLFYRHFTREALPRLDNYRNMMSIQAAYRPTLDELHNATLTGKVSPLPTPILARRPWSSN